MSSQSSKEKRDAGEITPAPTDAQPPPPKRSKKEVEIDSFEEIPKWDKSGHRVYVWNDYDDKFSAEYAKSVGERLPDRRVRRIRLMDHYLTDEFVEHMAKGMAGHRELQELAFPVNHIGDKGAAAIAKLLEHPRCRIYKLDLEENRLKHRGFVALAKAAAANRSLWTLRLRNNLRMSYERPKNWIIDFVSALTRSPSLRKVDLRNNSFTDWEAQQLFITWANGASVRKLDVSDVPGMFSDGSKALDAFMTLLATPDACPTHLKIKYTGVEKEFWAKLPKAVAANPRLRRLEIKEMRQSAGEYPYGIPTEEAYNIACKIEKERFAAETGDKSTYTDLNITLWTEV